MAEQSARAAAKFALGMTLITPGAQRTLTQQDVLLALRRHQQGDWGDVDAHDRRENELALGASLRLMSVYVSSAGEKFWVITEADRSATTILLPEEY